MQLFYAACTIVKPAALSICDVPFFSAHLAVLLHASACLCIHTHMNVCSV